MKANAVFEGGGIKGLALVGALCCAEDEGYTWQNVAGTSAGAIMASLVAAGYRGTEIKRLMKEVDFSKFKDAMLCGKLPVIGSVISLLGTKGLYKGDFFTQWLRAKLADKGVRKFGDLWTRKSATGLGQGKLQIIAADITRGKMLVLPQDIADFGVKPEDLEVAVAVRMSMSIPLFYQPVQWWYENGQQEKIRDYIVDGGILSNFPVWLFDNEVSEYPTFGFRLVGEGSKLQPRNITGPISLLTAVVFTMMDAHDRKYLEDADFARTICIPTLGVGVTDFEISRAKKEAMFTAGYRAANNFFQKWNFESYRATYGQTNIVEYTRKLRQA